MEKAHEPDEQIAERYFLGELSDDEAEAYEAHYFECERCAEYVVEELQMLESGRAVAMLDASRPAAPSPVANIAEARRKRREWLPMAAAAALVLAIGTPLLMRGPAQPAPVMTTIAEANIPELRFSADRDEAAPEQQFHAGEPIARMVSVPPADAPHVELTVRNAKTKEVVTGPERLTEEKLSSPFLLLLGPLPAGSYEVVIEGVREDGNRSPIASETIRVRR